MAYSAPTPADLKARYPAFADVPDATVQLWLDDAAVDCALWPDDARARAELTYTAHKLALLGQGAGAVPLGLTSFKSGTFAATVSDGLASLTGFSATVYGREFIAMRRVYFGGPVMAWTPPTDA